MRAIVAATLVCGLGWVLPAGGARAQSPIPIPTLPTSPPPVVAPPPPGPQSTGYGYDPAHDFAAADQALNAPLGSLWSTPVSGSPAMIAALDGHVFAVTRAGTASQVVALDASDGHAQWRTAVANGTVIAYQGGVLAVADGSAVRGYDAGSGRQLWSVSLPLAFALTPADDNFYAVGQSGSSWAVEALDARTGAVSWSAPIDGSLGLPQPVAVSGDRIYWSTTTSWGALDRRNGQPLWHQGNSAETYGEIDLLWRDRVFRTGGDDYGPTVVSAADGSGMGGVAVPVASGDVGLKVADYDHVDAVALPSGSRLWAAPDGNSNPGALAVVNNLVLLANRDVQLRDVSTGRLAWAARFPTPSSLLTSAVGNHELVVGSDGRITALVSFQHAAAPRIGFHWINSLSIYGGRPAKASIRITEPGILTSLPVRLTDARFPYRHAARPSAGRTGPIGGLSLTLHPALDTIYTLTVPGTASGVRFAVVALPRIRVSFGAQHGSRGTIRLRVDTPRQIRLAHRLAGLYVGRSSTRRYHRLGSGSVSGGRGHFTARFGFQLLRSLGPHDFVTVCFAGLYRQGMSFGDRLDRQCGASTIPF